MGDKGERAEQLPEIVDMTETMTGLTHHRREIVIRARSMEEAYRFYKKVKAEKTVDKQ